MSVREEVSEALRTTCVPSYLKPDVAGVFGKAGAK